MRHWRQQNRLLSYRASILVKDEMELDAKGVAVVEGTRVYAAWRSVLAEGPSGVGTSLAYQIKPSAGQPVCRP